ncbi:MAG: 16S rRNA (uracil(1498)-N(3))-methyltransferase [Mollicutes bacterium]|nr:16S rRNA (uracil(1498)-N(3))-methyltransferase [Mollicutes bacterium]
MQRYFAKGFQNNHFILSKQDYHHIKNVMRMKNKDKIEVVFNKKLFLCEIDNINSDIKINIIEELNHNNNKKKEITIIIPVLKEQKMDLILQKATELGVTEIIPVKMERSIVKLDERKLNQRLERWSLICKEASEQSKRIDIPKIKSIMDLNDLKNLDGLKIVCSTTPNIQSIKMYLKKHNACDKINIVIGPEGGLSPKEEEQLINIGFERISLGPQILRTETVPIAILSMINYEYME